MDMEQPPGRPRRWYLAGGGAALVAVALVVLLVVVISTSTDDPKATPDGLAAAVATAISQHDRDTYADLMCPPGPDRLADPDEMPSVPVELTVGPSRVLGPTEQDKDSSGLFELLIPDSDSAVVVNLFKNDGSTRWCLGAVSACELGRTRAQDLQQGGLCTFLVMIDDKPASTN